MILKALNKIISKMKDDKQRGFLCAKHNSQVKNLQNM